MDDKELSAILGDLACSLRHAQAVSLANTRLLVEIVRDLANGEKNRHDYLIGMFDRIGARVGRPPNEDQSRLIDGLFREELSKFFAEVAKSREAPENGDLATEARSRR